MKKPNNFKSASTDQHINAMDYPGITYCGNFRNGGGSPVLRNKAPKLCFSVSLSLQKAQNEVDTWNLFLRNNFGGVGYFAADQAAEIASPGNHVFALFADDEFYKAYMDSIVELEVVAVAEHAVA